MPTGKFLPSGLWTTEESWLNSQNPLVVLSTAFGLALGFAQLVLGAKLVGTQTLSLPPSMEATNAQSYRIFSNLIRTFFTVSQG